jgi:phosphatidylinositol alpha-mannosyltransferase
VRSGDFDVLHIHEPLAPSLSVLACWVARGPIVATWHSSYPRSRVLIAGYYLAQTAMEKVTARIAVSEDARRTLVDHLGGDAVLIPNGVFVRRFAETVPDDREARTGHTLMFLGRIDESRKGLPVLLEALPSIVERVPDVNLVVAGPGAVDDVTEDLEPHLRDRVTFLGMVSDVDKVRALHAADVYVAPNTGGESFGIVLLEAMASQTAVLASDLPAFDRVLDAGRAGVLFRTEDATDLADQAVALLTDPVRRAKVAAAGRERANDYDWDRVARQVLAVYESVTITGEKVQADLRGQVVGRLATRVLPRSAS